MDADPAADAETQGGRVPIRRIHKAEHLAGSLVYPVVPVIHPVLALDANVRLVSADHVAGLHAGDVMDAHRRPGQGSPRLAPDLR